MKRYDVFAIGSSYDGSAYTEECEYSDGKYVLYSDVAPLVEALKMARRELAEVLDWATVEKNPLRPQEIESIRRALSTIDATEMGNGGG